MAASIHDFAFDYEQLDWAHLSAVIPIVQHQQVDDLSQLVCSLETHVSGFHLVDRLSWMRASGSLLHLAWTASDDGGTMPTNATVFILTATAQGIHSATRSGDDQTAQMERTTMFNGPWRFVIPVNGNSRDT